MNEHDYSNMNDPKQLDALEGLAPRLSEQQVAGPAPQRATFRSANHSRMARAVAPLLDIDGAPSADKQDRYRAISELSRGIRASASDRGR